jgi:hypothetical protein
MNLLVNPDAMQRKPVNESAQRAIWLCCNKEKNYHSIGFWRAPE